MTQTLFATYDGSVLKIETPLPIRSNTRVRVTVECDETLVDAQAEPDVFGFIMQHSQDVGVSDWAENHDAYLYGTAGLQHACREMKLQQQGVLPEQTLEDFLKTL